MLRSETIEDENDTQCIYMHYPELSACRTQLVATQRLVIYQQCNEFLPKPVLCSSDYACMHFDEIDNFLTGSHATALLTTCPYLRIEHGVVMF